MAHTLVVGPSGSGKTSFLRSLLGLKHQKLHGCPTDDRPGLRYAVAWQEPRLLPDLNVIQNIEIVRKKGNNQENLQEIIHLLQIQGLIRQYPHQLSGGEAQRVNLARALFAFSDCLLLDEPLSSLDTWLVRQILPPLVDYLKKRKTSLFWVDHDLNLCAYFDKILVLKDLRVRYFGEVSTAFQQTEAWLAQFLGPHTRLNLGLLQGRAPQWVMVRPLWVGGTRHKASLRVRLIQSVAHYNTTCLTLKGEENSLLFSLLVHTNHHLSEDIFDVCFDYVPILPVGEEAVVDQPVSYPVF